MSDDGEVYDHTAMRDQLFIEHYRGRPSVKAFLRHIGWNTQKQTFA